MKNIENNKKKIKITDRVPSLLSIKFTFSPYVYLARLWFNRHSICIKSYILIYLLLYKTEIRVLVLSKCLYLAHAVMAPGRVNSTVVFLEMDDMF